MTVPFMCLVVDMHVVVRVRDMRAGVVVLEVGIACKVVAWSYG